MRRGKRSKYSGPNIIKPTIVETPPSVKDTGYPKSKEIRMARKNNSGSASKLITTCLYLDK